MTFTFTDFLIFSGASAVNEDTYSTIAKGVIGYLNETHGIYPEVTALTKKVFTASDQLSIDPQVFPVNSIDSITYDASLITDFTYYGDDILLTTAVSDIRKPVTIAMSVGFTEVPNDLVLAIYRHIIAVFHAIDKHTDNVSKTVNADGNTAYYLTDVVPIASLQTYRYYAANTLASF
jgi:hypothetical protein